jgi:hypothetical protein
MRVAEMPVVAAAVFRKSRRETGRGRCTFAVKGYLADGCGAEAL